jgi:hypothetical protein
MPNVEMMTADEYAAAKASAIKEANAATAPVTPARVNEAPVAEAATGKHASQMTDNELTAALAKLGYRRAR